MTILFLVGLLGPSAPAADFAGHVERALEAWRVPGAAVAMVKDGKVVLARGFGVRRAGAPGRVGPDTVFTIASLAKGFTAAAIAMLVDGKQLGFDDRVVERLPGFRVADAAVTREVTLRDLLAHRTGLSDAADALWAYSGYDRAEVLARLPALGQGSPLRTRFSYQNVHYLLLGEVLARRAGVPWDRFLHERVLAPLGMRRTATSLRELGALGEDVASPHADDQAQPRPIPQEDAAAIAPAAAMYASANDLARWMLVHLGRGELEGRRLWSEAAEAAMTGAQMLMPLERWERALYPETHLRVYGMGWVVQDYRGRAVVWNTGGMLGIACTVALLPEERFGVVVLTNGPRTSLPEALAFRAIDDALGAPSRDWSGIRLAKSLAGRAAGKAAIAERERARRKDLPSSLPLERYAGDYVQPLLGTFHVRAAAGRLEVQLARGLTGVMTPFEGERFLVTWANPLYGTSMATFTVAGGAARKIDVEDLGEFAR